MTIDEIVLLQLPRMISNPADVTGDLDLVHYLANLILVITGTESLSAPKTMIVEALSIAKSTKTEETVPEMVAVDTMTADRQVRGNTGTDAEAILPRSTNPENIDPDVTILKTAGIGVVSERIENLGEALITEVRMSHAENPKQKKLSILIFKRKNKQTSKTLNKTCFGTDSNGWQKPKNSTKLSRITCYCKICKTMGKYLLNLAYFVIIPYSNKTRPPEVVRKMMRKVSDWRSQKL